MTLSVTSDFVVCLLGCYFDDNVSNVQFFKYAILCLFACTLMITCCLFAATQFFLCCISLTHELSKRLQEHVSVLCTLP